MIHQVAEGIYRGPRPQSSNDFAALHRLGIRSMLDLETYALDFRGNEREQYIWRAAAQGIVTMSLPLGAVLPPSLDRLHLAVLLLKVQGQQIDKTLPRPVYVHCRQGVDRTGMVIAAYRIAVEKTRVEDAADEMLEMGFHHRYLWWIPQLGRFARR